MKYLLKEAYLIGDEEIQWIPELRTYIVNKIEFWYLLIFRENTVYGKAFLGGKRKWEKN